VTHPPSVELSISPAGRGHPRIPDTSATQGAPSAPTVTTMASMLAAARPGCANDPMNYPSAATITAQLTALR
jgi:hypothetical protein